MKKQTDPEAAETVQTTEPEAVAPAATCSAFVVTAYRWGLRDGHSYVVGASKSLDIAKNMAIEEESWRGGKYGVAVEEVPTEWREDRGSKVVFYAGGTAGGEKPEEKVIRDFKKNVQTQA